MNCWLTIYLPADLAVAHRRFKAQQLTDMTDEEAVVSLMRDGLIHMRELEQEFDLEDVEAEGNA